MKHVVMVVIHLICLFFISFYLLIITIPLHIIISMMGGKKEVGTNDFVGPRDVKNVNYRDYLVRRYEITKNDVLNVYSFDNKAYENIDDVLREAAIKDGGKID